MSRSNSMLGPVAVSIMGGSLLSDVDSWATLCPPLVGTSRVAVARLESRTHRC
jgi:hypothetical protein